MTMMMEALLRRRRDFYLHFLSNHANVLDDAPLLFTELFFTFCALLNSREVFALVLLNGCAAGDTFYVLKSRNDPSYVVCKVRFIVSFCCNTLEFPIILRYYNIF